MVNEEELLLKRKQRLENKIKEVLGRENINNDDLHTLFNLYTALGEVEDHLEVFNCDIQG
jgi:hypothetical protein